MPLFLTGSVKCRKSSTNTTVTGMFWQVFTLIPVVLEFFPHQWSIEFCKNTWLTFLCPHGSHPHLIPLEQAKLKQCVVGPNHAGFLLEVTFIMLVLCYFISPIALGFFLILKEQFTLNMNIMQLARTHVDPNQ